MKCAVLNQSGTMLVFIHTITISSEEFQLSTRFYHALKANIASRRIQTCLLGKKVAVSVNRRRWTKDQGSKRPARVRFNTRHDLEAIKIDASLATVTRGYAAPPAPAVVPTRADGGPPAAQPSCSPDKLPSPLPLSTDHGPAINHAITPESNPQQTAQWLRRNSFGNYTTTFANFNGADILRLTRDDLIQICGLADGIRLLYALHAKAIVRLTLYLCTPGSAVYHALYLDQVSRGEVARKLSALLGVHPGQIQDMYIQGPNGIRVLLTDEVVSNIKDEAMFVVEMLKDVSRDRLVLMLKPSQPST